MNNTYRPRHARTDMPWYYRITDRTQDADNRARCRSYGAPSCDGVCPRHTPGSYADCMARHATDSFPVTR